MRLLYESRRIGLKSDLPLYLSAGRAGSVERAVRREGWEIRFCWRESRRTCAEGRPAYYWIPNHKLVKGYLRVASSAIRAESRSVPKVFGVLSVWTLSYSARVVSAGRQARASPSRTSTRSYLKSETMGAPDLYLDPQIRVSLCCSLDSCVWPQADKDPAGCSSELGAAAHHAGVSLWLVVSPACRTLASRPDDASSSWTSAGNRMVSLITIDVEALQ